MHTGISVLSVKAHRRHQILREMVIHQHIDAVQGLQLTLAIEHQELAPTVHLHFQIQKL